jgi:hypothetical protein
MLAIVGSLFQNSEQNILPCIPDPDVITDSHARLVGLKHVLSALGITVPATLILLDTCEAGALTSGFARLRVNGPASEAGVGRLHEATGRPVPTAAAQRQFCHEGQITSTGKLPWHLHVGGTRCAP